MTEEQLREIVTARMGPLLEPRLVEAQIEELQLAIKILERAGLVIVPKEPTTAMLNAAIDVDAFKLGDISPIGFRMSPQQLFEKCYAAMIRAAQESK